MNLLFPSASAPFDFLVIFKKHLDAEKLKMLQWSPIDNSGKNDDINEEAEEAEETIMVSS